MKPFKEILLECMDGKTKYSESIILQAMKIACEEVLDEAAKKAEPYFNDGAYGNPCSFGVNEDSILSIKKRLK